MNEKKLYRIYSAEGSSVRRKGGRTPMPVPLHPNQRPLLADCFAIACRSMASLDFLSDTLGACRKFSMLAVNDDCGRENLGLITDTLAAALLPALRTAK